jgi:hypothetical protein
VFRCGRCGAATASVWLLGTAGALWAASLLAYGIGRFFVFAELARLYEGLGSAPPPAARAYFGLSDLLLYGVAAVALLGPALILLVWRAEPAGAWRWARRYAVSAVLSLVWVSLGAAVYYLAVTSLASRL